VYGSKSFNFCIFLAALADHSVSCSEKIVNLHEATLEALEQAVAKSGKLGRIFTSITNGLGTIVNQSQDKTYIPQ